MVMWLGIGIVLAGVLMVAPLRWGPALVLFCLPLSGTAVMMLGADPLLLPLFVCVAFLARHSAALFSRPFRDSFIELLRREWALIAFVAYAVVSGLFFPRLFEGRTIVSPQSGALPLPLGPWLISFPQLGYLVFGAWSALAVRHVVSISGYGPALWGLTAQAVFIAGIGFLQAGLGAAGVTLPLGWIVNNTGYALLLDIVENGFTRITSVFVEASSYAGWAVGALGFFYGLYVARIRPWLSLALCAVLAATLLLSTSTTAYAGAAVLSAFVVVHAMLDPDTRRRNRALLIVAGGVFFFAIAALLVFTAEDGFLYRLRDMVETMTFRKSMSVSGIDRANVAARSIQNGVDTAFLGAGFGAARSSGLFHALFGVVGAPGLALFVLFLWPRLAGAFRRMRTGEDAVSAAAAFGLIGLVSGMAISAADLGFATLFWGYLALVGARQTRSAAASAEAAALRPEAS